MGGGNKKNKRKNRNKSNTAKQNGDEPSSSTQSSLSVAPSASAADDPPHQRNNNNNNNKKKKSSAGDRKAMISSTVATIQNPLFTKLQAFLNGLTPTERDCFFSNQHVTPERRAEIWMQQAEIGEELVNLYSWAIVPGNGNGDDHGRCMRILAHFAPLVEMGCGKNAYWCRQMTAVGIHVIGYDLAPQSGGLIIHSNDNSSKSNGGKHGNSKGPKKLLGGNKTDHDSDSFQVRQGGPKDLSKHSDRTLFLCYPDENDGPQNDNNDNDDNEQEGEEETSLSMGARCLEHYTGNHVIHVGEMYGDTNSMEQAPWGRSSSPEFQQRLASEFHCILQVALPGWLHVRDTLTVWKRSQVCTIVYAQDDDEDDDDDDEGDEEVNYRHVPVEERLPMDRAAPCLAHLLGSSLSSSLAMSIGAANTDDTITRHSHENQHASKKPKLQKEDSAKQAKRSPKPPRSKEEEQPAFSKEAGYNAPW